MTLEEAERIINPETSLEAYVEIDYYGGFEGNKRWKKAVDEATVIAAQALREKAEREKGCEYCKGRAYTKKPLTVTTIHGRKISLAFEYCPNCGRKLKKDGDNNA